MKALYTTIKRLAPHPNADRLLVTTIEGHHVIVGTSTKVGDHGLFISEGSQVSEEFALRFGLLREHPLTGAKLSGYMPANRKVSAITLRGQDSMGVFVPVRLPDIEPDTELDHLDGKPFVWKYETPAQRARHGGRIGGPRQKAPHPAGFDLHYDTLQLNRNAQLLADVARIVVTEKLHGTSGRTGIASVEKPLPKFKKLWNRAAPKFLAFSPDTSDTVVTGSRTQHFASAPSRDLYRTVIHNALTPIIQASPYRSTWYYEIVGFAETGKGIMPNHGRMCFAYGCRPPRVGESPEEMLGQVFRVYVYRIVECGAELGHSQIVALIARAHAADARSESWLFPVPALETWHPDEGVNWDPAKIVERVAPSRDGRSTLDSSHIREGVVLRGEGHHGRAITRALKAKSHAFLKAEGALLEDDSLIDPEDVA